MSNLIPIFENLQDFRRQELQWNICLHSFDTVVMGRVYHFFGVKSVINNSVSFWKGGY